MKLQDVLSNAVNNDSIKQFLTEQAKNDLVIWMGNKGVPTIRDFAKEWLDGLSKQAASETGWCKMRDALYLPAIVTVILWLMEKSTEFMVSHVQKDDKT